MGNFREEDKGAKNAKNYPHAKISTFTVLCLGYIRPIFNLYCVGATEAAVAEQAEKLKLAKEAVISKENIGDDALGDEDWNVISQEDRYDIL